jgi:hypothetical protein
VAAMKVAAGKIKRHCRQNAVEWKTKVDERKR